MREAECTADEAWNEVNNNQLYGFLQHRHIKYSGNPDKDPKFCDAELTPAGEKMCKQVGNEGGQERDLVRKAG